MLDILVLGKKPRKKSTGVRDNKTTEKIELRATVVKKGKKENPPPGYGRVAGVHAPSGNPCNCN
jgi:hypothetical protein